MINLLQYLDLILLSQHVSLNTEFPVQELLKTEIFGGMQKKVKDIYFK